MDKKDTQSTTKKASSNYVGFRVDDPLMKSISDFSEKKKIKKSVLCRRIINDYFSQEKYDNINEIADKLEIVIPNLEAQSKDYVAMKDSLKQTLTDMYEVMTEVKEMKKGHFLTYKTLQSQKETFEALIATLSGK